MNDHSSSTCSCSNAGSSSRRARDGRGPEVLDHGPCIAQAGRVGRTQLDPLGVTTIQLRLDERADVDAVHAETNHFAAELDIDEERPANPKPLEIHVTEARVLERGVLDRRVGEVDAAEACALEHDLLEGRVGEVDELEGENRRGGVA